MFIHKSIIKKKKGKQLKEKNCNISLKQYYPVSVHLFINMHVYTCVYVYVPLLFSFNHEIVSHSFATPWANASQAHSVHRTVQARILEGVGMLSSRVFLTQGVEPMSPALDYLPLSLGKPIYVHIRIY